MTDIREKNIKELGTKLSDGFSSLVSMRDILINLDEAQTKIFKAVIKQKLNESKR